MKLEEFFKICSKERDELKKRLAEPAKSLTLPNIESYLQFSPLSYYSIHKNFEDGDTIIFSAYNGWYDFRICRLEASLTGPWDIKIKKFEGQEVKDLYSNWSAEILKAKEQDILPF